MLNETPFALIDDMLLSQITSALQDAETQALLWLPENGSSKDRGSSMNAPSPAASTLEMLRHWKSGNSREHVALSGQFVEPAFEDNRPRELDEHWRLTPLGQKLVRHMKGAA